MSLEKLKRPASSALPCSNFRFCETKGEFSKSTRKRPQTAISRPPAAKPPDYFTSSMCQLQSKNFLLEEMQHFEKRLPAKRGFEGFSLKSRQQSQMLSSTQGYRLYKQLQRAGLEEVVLGRIHSKQGINAQHLDSSLMHKLKKVWFGA